MNFCANFQKPALPLKLPGYAPVLYCSQFFFHMRGNFGEKKFQPSNKLVQKKKFNKEVRQKY